jgi:hypothetical protein
MPCARGAGERGHLRTLCRVNSPAKGKLEAQTPTVDSLLLFGESFPVQCKKNREYLAFRRAQLLVLSGSVVQTLILISESVKKSPFLGLR